MFVGHFAVALGAKAGAPRVPLGLLVAAAFGLDLLWPVLLLTGAESVRIDPGNTAFTPLAFDSYPWSHSLVMSLVWGAVLAAAAYPKLRSSRAAAILVAVVVSHWLLDFVTHRPDMPLWPGSAKFGLGLWNSIPATLLVEGALFGGAVHAYRTLYVPRDRTGAWAFLALIGLLTAIWLAGPFSPPPPDVSAIAMAGLAMWLFPLWASWIERHRAAAKGKVGSS